MAGKQNQMWRVKDARYPWWLGAVFQGVALVASAVLAVWLALEWNHHVESPSWVTPWVRTWAVVAWIMCLLNLILLFHYRWLWFLSIHPAKPQPVPEAYPGSAVDVEDLENGILKRQGGLLRLKVRNDAEQLRRESLRLPIVTEDVS